MSVNYLEINKRAVDLLLSIKKHTPSIDKKLQEQSQRDRRFTRPRFGEFQARGVAIITMGTVTVVTRQCGLFRCS
jgi:hypothetical protein